MPTHAAAQLQLYVVTTTPYYYLEVSTLSVVLNGMTRGVGRDSGRDIRRPFRGPKRPYRSPWFSRTPGPRPMSCVYKVLRDEVESRNEELGCRNMQAFDSEEAMLVAIPPS